MREPPRLLPREAGVAADAFRLETDMIECRYTPYRGCRIALRRSVSTPNLRPEHGRMSRSSDQIVGGIYRMSNLTEHSRELCDSLYQGLF
jgi:hypothetical protein